MMKIGYIREYEGYDDEPDYRMLPQFYTEKEVERLDRWTMRKMKRIIYMELPEE